MSVSFDTLREMYINSSRITRSVQNGAPESTTNPPKHGSGSRKDSFHDIEGPIEVAEAKKKL